MAQKKKNSDGYDGDSYDDDNGQLNLDDQLFNADMRHYRETELFTAQVERMYMQAINDLTKLASQMPTLPQSKSFEFKHNPNLSKAAQATIERLAARIVGVIDAGCRQEWDAACIKGDEYVKRIMDTSGLTEDQVRRYQDRNLEALAAFQERKVDGLNLSERVWKMVKPLREEVELAIDTSTKYFDHGVGINTQDAISKIQGAIGKGTSAAELSREVRQCLQKPDMLFRRVKDKYGNLTLSKAAKLYHPGPGVYRSSYKNAMRLTRSEINMAYRQSDTMRWQQLDFVVGMEVHISNNHTTPDPKSKRKLQLIDICDELKGKYPKDFKFVGWHPQCRCYMTPILKTREEMNEDRANIDDPDYVPKQSVNAVTDTPKGFQQYMQDNAERMKGWSSTPYYIKDNPHYFDRAMHPGSYKAGNALQLTADQSKALSDFQAYANNHQGSKKFAAALEQAQKAHLAGDIVAFEKSMKDMRNQIHNFGSSDSVITNTKPGEYISTGIGEIKKQLKKLSENYEREEAFAILKDGRVFHKVGYKDVVLFDENELDILKGAVLYHNHPRDTFSPTDIIFSIHRQLKSISVITADTEYTAIITNKALRNVSCTKEEFDAIYDAAGDKIEKEIMRMNSKDAGEALIRFPELQMIEFCKMLGIKYRSNKI